MPANGPRRVLVLEFEDYSWLGQMCNGFHARINKASQYKRITKLNSGIAEARARPNAVVLFEPSIIKQAKKVKMKPSTRHSFACVKSGGIVAILCQCSNARPSDADWYFESVWNLPWKFAKYARFESQPNPNATNIHRKNVPIKYNAKYIQRNNVGQNSVVYCQVGEMHGLTGILPTPGNQGNTSGPVV
jgi:hypothetical protein